MDIVRQKGLTVRELKDKLKSAPDDYVVYTSVMKECSLLHSVFIHGPTKGVYLGD